MSTFRYWFVENRTWIFIWFSVFIITTLSFGFGYFVARQANPAPIIIEKCSDPSS